MHYRHSITCRRAQASKLLPPRGDKSFFDYTSRKKSSFDVRDVPKLPSRNNIK